MLTSRSSKLKLLAAFTNASVALLVALGILWQGHSSKIMLLLFLASKLTELFRPAFTEVLPTARDTQLSHIISIFYFAILVDLKILTIVYDLDKHTS